ncbi:MAG: PPOX class F420-dependent oxidoreductase [Gaiellales bacterium]
MVIPDGFDDLLSANVIVHLATVRPDGQLQSNPMLFEWDGERFKMSLTRSRQKYRNLLDDPRVAVSFTDPTNPYRYLELRGTVDRIDEDADNAFVNSLAKRYMGEDEYSYDPPGAERVIVSFVPQSFSQQGAPA